MKEIKKKVFGIGLTAVYATSAVTGLTGCGHKPDTDIQESMISQEQREEKTQNKQILLANEMKDNYQNRAVRALESVNAQLGEEEYLKMVGTLGSAEHAESQGEYVSSLLSTIEGDFQKEQNGNKMEQANSCLEATKVMRACGYQCIEPSIIEKAKKLYQESDDMENFIRECNENGIGGKLVLDGNTIHATYEKCYCSIDQKKKLPGCYCQCSCGWFEKLFSTVLEQPVTVELQESIISGGDVCKFDIILDEEGAINEN